MQIEFDEDGWVWVQTANCDFMLKFFTVKSLHVFRNVSAMRIIMLADSDKGQGFFKLNTYLIIYATILQYFALSHIIWGYLTSYDTIVYLVLY